MIKKAAIAVSIASVIIAASTAYAYRVDDNFKEVAEELSANRERTAVVETKLEAQTELLRETRDMVKELHNKMIHEGR